MKLPGTRTHEERKRLGQYFTGPELSRLLAALADSESAARVIDPMAGCGDLVVAVHERGGGWLRLDAVEIDPLAASVCSRRLVLEAQHAGLRVADAFNPTTWREIANDRWDLVITNPPYVRYQRGRSDLLNEIGMPNAAEVRAGLLATIDERTALSAEDRQVWQRVVEQYGGLSDLAVPSWILCAAMVEPGGRLAMVVPDTWLSRDYALPVLYLLLRYFEIDAVVEDGDASWFPDALVRTTLLVARRVADRGTALAELPASYPHVRLDATTRTASSMVGALYPDRGDPELAFVTDLRFAVSGSAARDSRVAGRTRFVPDAHLRSLLQARLVSTAWGADLDGGRVRGCPPLRGAVDRHAHLPSEVVHSLGLGLDGFTTLGKLGWEVGQGLRTGANRFFYCTAVESEAETELVEVDPWLSSSPLRLERCLLEPVIRKQQDLAGVLAGTSTPGRLLVLGDYALQEDISHAVRQGVQPTMSSLGNAASDLVRRAAQMPVVSAGRERLVPQLSAVATNVRAVDPARPERQPRFWYQLPPLVQRHRPDVFMPRVNHLHAAAILNRGLVVDANFSTFWPTDTPELTSSALAALLNSSWVAAVLETTATVLGGGALKVEAAHLRSLPVPHLSGDELSALATIGDLLGCQDLAIESIRSAADEALKPALRRSGAADDAIEMLRTLAMRRLRMRNPRAFP